MARAQTNRGVKRQQLPPIGGCLFVLCCLNTGCGARSSPTLGDERSVGDGQGFGKEPKSPSPSSAPTGITSSGPSEVTTSLPATPAAARTSDDTGCDDLEQVEFGPMPAEFRGTVNSGSPYVHPQPDAFAMASFFEEGLFYPVREVEGEFIPGPEGLRDSVGAVWAEAQDDVYLGAGASTVLHHVDGQWLSEPLLDTEGASARDPVTSITRNGVGELWAVGRALYQRNNAGQWVALEMPTAPASLGSVWLGDEGFGVAVSEQVYITRDGGQSWQDDTRNVGLLAAGSARTRRYSHVHGHGERAAIITDGGQLLLRVGDQWEAQPVNAKAAHVTARETLVATAPVHRGSGSGSSWTSETALLIDDGSTEWQAYPMTRGGWGGKGGGYYQLSHILDTGGGHIYATGNFEGAYHRYPDGSWEFVPLEVVPSGVWANDELLLHGDYAGYWRYDMSTDATGSGVFEAAASASDDDFLSDTTEVGIYPPNFEPPECVDETLGSPPSRVTTEVEVSESSSIGSQCGPVESSAMVRRFGFRAPTTGTYQFWVGGTTDVGVRPTLRLSSTCGGTPTYGAVPIDASLQAGQYVVLQVTAEQDGGVDATTPVALRLSVR